ncbi:inorganic diphosphatase [Kitasatospora azatica]|uniref:inorganic diphosphatase n=1 Tax=Kitasatospora azatica TaxID=58347 RepID=UPI000A672D7F|nr:inorganic diphosphatase [Kitasatospora azatica]
MSRISVELEPAVGSTISTTGVGPADAEARPVGSGRLPDTLSEDGEPLEVLVLMPSSVAAGETVEAQPVALVHLRRKDQPRDEVLCVVDDPHHAESPRWQVDPEAWAAALARVAPSGATEMTGWGSRAEADHFLAEAQHACQRLTGCLE